MPFLHKKYFFLSPNNVVDIHLSIDIKKQLIISAKKTAYYVTTKIKHINLLTVIEPLRLGSQAPCGIIHRRHEYQPNPQSGTLNILN